MADNIRKIAEKAYAETVGDDDTEQETPTLRAAEEEMQEQVDEERDTEEAQEQDDTEPQEQEEAEVEVEKKEPETDYMALIHPKALNEEERQLFDQLPNRKSKKLVKDLVTRLQLSHQNTLNHSIHKLNQEFEKEIAPYRDLDKIRQSYQHHFSDGTTPVEKLENSLEWDDYLEESPHAALLELMRQYGVNPQDYLNGQAHRKMFEPKPQDTEDSEVVKELKAIRQEREQEKQQRVIGQIDSDLATFTNATDKNGVKLFPLVDYVAPLMAPIVKDLRLRYPEAKNLEILPHAYSAALAQAPKEVQDLIQSMKNKKETKRPGKQPTSLSPKNNGRAGAKPKSNRSIRQIAEEAWESVND